MHQGVEGRVRGRHGSRYIGGCWRECSVPCFPGGTGGSRKTVGPHRLYAALQRFLSHRMTPKGAKGFCAPATGQLWREPRAQEVTKK